MFYDFWTHLRDVHFRIPNMPNAFKHIAQHNTTQSVNQPPSIPLPPHPKSRLEIVLVSYRVLAIFCYLGAFNTIECFVKIVSDMKAKESWNDWAMQMQILCCPTEPWIQTNTHTEREREKKYNIPSIFRNVCYTSAMSNLAFGAVVIRLWNSNCLNEQMCMCVCVCSQIYCD